MNRARVLALSVAVAVFALPGWEVLVPAPERQARTDLLIRFSRCGLSKDTCPDGRPWVEPDDRRSRVSAGGFFYGECGGRISAVFLIPEPCERAEKPIAEAGLPSPP